MPFARIAHFQYQPETLDNTIALVKASLLPLFQKIPGFISYTIVKYDSDRGLSIVKCQTRDQADEALKRAAEWNRVHARETTLSLEAFIGEIAYEYDHQGESPGAAVVEAAIAAFNEKRFDRLAALSQPDADVMDFAHGTVTPLRAYWEHWANAFPDGKIEITRLVASDDSVVVEYVGRGIHTGTLDTPMGSIEATNKAVENPMAAVFDLRGGKVASCRVYFDAAGFLRQLGIEAPVTVPRMGETAPHPEMLH